MNKTNRNNAEYLNRIKIKPNIRIYLINSLGIYIFVLMQIEKKSTP